MKVFHGVTGAAGQPAMISKSQRSMGISAYSIMVSKSKFGYQADHNVELKGDGFEQYREMLLELAPEYDVFHFYFRPIFFYEPSRLEFPTAYDLMLLRLMGKKIIFNYRGSEVRSGTKFKEFSPFNYVDENPSSIFTKFPDEQIERMTGVVRSLAHEIIVPDPELQSYVPGAKIVPRAIDLKEWEYVGLQNQNCPLVIHAPSRREVKGTRHVLEAVEELKKEGLNFEFKLIENLSNHEAKEQYKKADIVVDQLRIGWYGVLATETMALGKVVLAYIREDLWHHLDKDSPLVNANPDTIKDRLRDVILDYPGRLEISKRARAFCEKTHDAEKVSAQLIDMYSNAGNNSAFVENIEPLLELMNHHKIQLDKLKRKNKLLAAKLNRKRSSAPSTSKLNNLASAYRKRGALFCLKVVLNKLLFGSVLR